MTICAITGHRPSRFSFGYDECAPLCVSIKAALQGELARLYNEQEVRRIYVGGALGVDMWAGEAVVAFRDTGCPDLELCVAIPFRGHDMNWPVESKKRLRALCSQAEVVLVSEHYAPDAYERRNCWMVDRAQVLLAVFSVEGSLGRSGTAQTVSYARRKGIPTVFIHPDTGSVDRRFFDG